MIYSDKSSSFQDLLNRNRSVCFHHRNIQYLAIELYKAKQGISPSFVGNIFEKNTGSFSGRNTTFFKSRKIKSTLHGSESLSFLGPKIWELIPSEMQNATSLINFKLKIKKWIPDKCPCRICRKYIEGVGFIE